MSQVKGNPEAGHNKSLPCQSGVLSTLLQVHPMSMDANALRDKLGYRSSTSIRQAARHLIKNGSIVAIPGTRPQQYVAVVEE